MKVHLIGLLQHLPQNHLRLYTTKHNHARGSNHIIEVLHRFINALSDLGEFTRIIFVQLDNCIRETKNKYFLSYLYFLVHMGVFDEVQASFLPVGHTHIYVDQSFSTTTDRLRCQDKITMADLESEVQKCYNSLTTVSSLKHVANWSELCNQQYYCNSIHHITNYLYFKVSVLIEIQSIQEFESQKYVVMLVALWMPHVNCLKQTMVFRILYF